MVHTSWLFIKQRNNDKAEYAFCMTEDLYHIQNILSFF